MRSERRVTACGRIARGGRLAALAACLFLLAACSPDIREQRARDPRPDVILVSLDTTRADHLSVYGYARPTSSRLEALAAEGTRVRVAYAPSATTGPSHASLFTALPPIAHGVRKNGHRLAAAHATLAEQLGQAGYETAAVVSSYVLDARFGYDRGFAHYDDDLSQAQTPSGTTLWEGREIEGRFYGRADDTTDRALRWLRAREHPDRPFFLFVHYFDPHDPYLPPADFAPPFAPTAKEALKLNRTIFRYDTLLAYVDRELGRLLDTIDADGLSRDRLLVVTADHGEGLMAHGHMFHGVHVYEEAVRVPLILHSPGRVPGGRVVESPFALVDLAPALLELIGAAAEAPLGRRGLAARLLGEEVEPADAPWPIFLYRRHYAGEEAGDEVVGEGLRARGEQFGVREGRWKLVVGPEEGTVELYDLERDPGETLDLAADEPEQVARLRAAIDAWRAEHGGNGGAVAPIEEGDRDALRALGYGE